MQWNDEAIVLAGRHHGETSAVVTLFTHNYGKKKGYIKGGYRKGHTHLLTQGHLVKADWFSRLAENLGTYKLESIFNPFIYYSHDYTKLLALQSLTHLLTLCLEDEVAFPDFYKQITYFLTQGLQEKNWLHFYCLLEKNLLRIAGFGLSTEACAVTGKQEDLIYLSPKTGRSVCADIGKPYHDKLFSLPHFFVEIDAGSCKKDYGNALKITGYFIENHILSWLNMPLPHSRLLLLNHLQESLDYV